MPVAAMTPPGAVDEERRKDEDKRFRDQKYLQGLLKENQELLKQRRGQPAPKPRAPAQGPGRAPQAPQAALLPPEPIIPGGISRAFNKRVLPRSGQPGYEEWRGKLEKAMAYHAERRRRFKGIVSPQEQVAAADLEFRTSPKGAAQAMKGGQERGYISLRGRLTAEEKRLAYGRDVRETTRVEGVTAGAVTTKYGRGLTTAATEYGRDVATREDEQAFEAEQAGLEREQKTELARLEDELKRDLATRKRQKDEAKRAKKRSGAEHDLAIKEVEDELAVAEKEEAFQRTRSLKPVKEDEGDVVANNRRLAAQEYALKKDEVVRLRGRLKDLRRKKIAPQVDRVDEMAGADAAPVPLPPDPQEWIAGTVYVNEAGIKARWNGTEFEIVQDA